MADEGLLDLHKNELIRQNEMRKRTYKCLILQLVNTSHGFYGSFSSRISARMFRNRGNTARGKTGKHSWRPSNMSVAVVIENKQVFV